jgi:hypothetical protein
MPFIAGTSLDDWIKKNGTPSQKQVAGLIRKLAVALLEAHRRGVIHRDLKPGNIMIEKTARGTHEPIIVDFGLARREKGMDLRLTRTGAPMGTPAYMPPEQLKGQLDKMGVNCDVYSLGATMYELLTGKLPFNKSNWVALTDDILHAPPPHPKTLRPDVDPRLAEICLKCLTKKPEDRYPSMKELADDLESYLNPRPPSAKPSPKNTVEAVFADIAGVTDRPLRQAVAPGRRDWVLLGVLVAAVAGVVFLLFTGVVVYVATDYGTVKIELSDPQADVQIKVDGNVVTLKSPDGTVTLKPGKHEMEVTSDTFKTVTKSFTLKRGKNESVVVTLEAKDAAGAPGRTSPAAGAVAATVVSKPKSESPRANGRIPGIVAWYRLDGVVEDAVGNNRPSLIRDISFVTGKTGQGAKFAANGYIEIPDAPALSNLTYTLEAWVRPDGPGPDDDALGSVIIGKGRAGGIATTVILSWRSTDDRFVLTVGDVGTRLVSSRTFAPGQFYHVAASNDGAIHKLYVNGVFEGQLAQANTPVYEASIPWSIGANPSLFSIARRTWNGVIDEVAIYNRALTDAEIRFLYDPAADAAAMPSVTKAESGFLPLFNGKDLTGWSVDTGNLSGDASQWTVANGVIVAQSPHFSKRNYLLTDKDYTDFVLRFEFAVDEKSHGAVALRAVPGEQVPYGNQTIFDHPLIKLSGPGRPPTDATGASHWLRDGNAHTLPLRAPAMTVGGWHKLEVTVQGPVCTATLDGKGLVDTTLHPNENTYSGIVPGLKRTSGKVGFQINTGTVRYRNIEIKELPAPPPPGAAAKPPEWRSLFNGKDLTGWVGKNGQPAAWKAENDYVEVTPGLGNIWTKETFGDFELHAEFWIPREAGKKDQGRGNSGIYLQGRYEIQILDSFDNPTKPEVACGALYGQIAPSKNASKPPGEWQSFDITFRAPRVDSNGNVTAQGRLTVLLNGSKVIDNAQFDKASTQSLDANQGTPGPIMLQDHGNRVRFRNLRIKPMDGQAQ